MFGGGAFFFVLLFRKLEEPNPYARIFSIVIARSAIEEIIYNSYIKHF